MDELLRYDCTSSKYLRSPISLSFLLIIDSLPVAKKGKGLSSLLIQTALKASKRRKLKDGSIQEHIENLEVQNLISGFKQPDQPKSKYLSSD